MAFRYTKLQKEWLHDLKTTRAKQGQGFLHTDGWCCLGRALHVMGVKRSRSAGIDFFEGNDRYMPERRYKQLRLRSLYGKTKYPFEVGGAEFEELVTANDHGCTFKQIAAAIEADPSNFFTNGEKR